jgi:hypothetical protein
VGVGEGLGVGVGVGVGDGDTEALTAIDGMVRLCEAIKPFETMPFG